MGHFQCHVASAQRTKIRRVGPTTISMVFLMQCSVRLHFTNGKKISVIFKY